MVVQICSIGHLYTRKIFRNKTLKLLRSYFASLPLKDKKGLIKAYSPYPTFRQIKSVRIKIDVIFVLTRSI